MPKSITAMAVKVEDHMTRRMGSPRSGNSYGCQPSRKCGAQVYGHKELHTACNLNQPGADNTSEGAQPPTPWFCACKTMRANQPHHDNTNPVVWRHQICTKFCRRSPLTHLTMSQSNILQWPSVHIGSDPTDLAPPP